MVERELVGGDCSFSACIPSKTLLRPGKAIQAARDAAATAEVDVEAALAWRELMVSDHSDAGQAAWLADHGADPGFARARRVAKYQARDSRRQHPRRAARGEPRGGAARHLHRSAGDAVGATGDAFSATVRLADVARTATYTRASGESNGYLTLRRSVSP